MTFFHHLPDFQKGASHKLYPNFSKNQILFHHKIKIEGTVISRQVWRRLGIRTIGQLTSENFEFLEYSRFTTKFGNDSNFLEYYGMIKAIKKNIKKVSTGRMNLAQIQPKQSRTQSCNLKGKEQKQSETYCVKILGCCRKRWQNGITPFWV